MPVSRWSAIGSFWPRTAAELTTDTKSQATVPNKFATCRGRPPKSGKHKISLAKRAAHRHGWEAAQCEVYGRTVTKLYKTFLATYRPTGGVIVEEEHAWYPFFSTDPNATAMEIIEHE